MGKASSLLRPRKALHVMRLQMSQCLSLLLLEARGGTAPQVAKLLRSFQLPRTATHIIAQANVYRPKGMRRGPEQSTVRGSHS